MKLNGTAAIVSGGASGLGEATVRELAAAGSKVVVADLNSERGKALADEVGGLFARTDVSDADSVRAAVELAASAGAPLRFVVSCAGIGWAQRTVGRDGEPHDRAAFGKVIDVNLIGTFNLMSIGAAAVAKTAPADADGARGVVINTASIAGLGGPDRPARLLGIQGRHHRHDRAGRPGPGGHRRPGQHHLPRHHRHADLRQRAGQRGIQGQARRPGGVPQADGHGRGVRAPGPDR